MTADKPIAESPQLQRERTTAFVTIALLILILPTLVVLICDVGHSQHRTSALWFTLSGMFAAVFVCFYWSRWRMWGFIPYAAFAWVLAVAHGVYWHEWLAWAHGVLWWLILTATARGRRGKSRREEYLGYAVALVIGVALASTFREQEQPILAEWFILIAAIALLVWSVRKMFRPLFELTCEPILWLMYRVRGVGPGFENFPTTGPCIVIANHACWLDPIFLAKLLPRPTTPMMTARFYDKPIIRRLMVLFGVIRVPEKAVRRDAPEIQEAIAALDRGECVVIFPEGYLRRTEERPLRRFGQGVWQVLQARPNTPVFAAWIEGGWGSYTSYFNGPPMKNKKKDFRRPIAVGMSAAATVPPELLAEHLKTRIHLMNLVSEARKHLGLEPLPLFTLLEKEEINHRDTENTEEDKTK